MLCGLPQSKDGHQFSIIIRHTKEDKIEYSAIITRSRSPNEGLRRTGIFDKFLVVIFIIIYFSIYGKSAFSSRLCSSYRHSSYNDLIPR